MMSYFGCKTEKFVLASYMVADEHQLFHPHFYTVVVVSYSEYYTIQLLYLKHHLISSYKE